jgi:hypothetical protein
MWKWWLALNKYGGDPIQLFSKTLANKEETGMTNMP